MSTDEGPLAIDRLVHEPVRMALLSVLDGVSQADFAFLQGALQLSQGNLSAHLSKLEAGGLVEAVTDQLATMRVPNDAIVVYLLNLAKLLDTPEALAGTALSSVGKEFRATFDRVMSGAQEEEPDAIDIAKAEVALKRAEMAERRMEREAQS